MIAFNMSLATLKPSAPLARFGITFNGAPIPWVEHVSERNARKAIDWMAQMLGCSPTCFAVVVGHCGECNETACLCAEVKS